MPPATPIPPSPLRLRAAAVGREALATGALLPLGTRTFSVPDEDLCFRVHLLDRMTHKVRRTDDLRATGSNPFLPPEPELTVAPWGEHHLAVLNKFPVVAEHLLLITRAFEHQQSLLTEADFAAAAAALAEIDGLVFYNGGAEAGASQAHKHLQLIPLPLADWPPPPAERVGPAEVRWRGRFPLEPAWQAAPPARDPRQPTRSPELPFRHTLHWLPPGVDGAWLRAAFLASCVALGLTGLAPCYNLLLTRRQLLVVPRVRERTGGVALNALAFAGSLLVPHPALLEQVRQVGPLRLLRGVVEPDADLPAPERPPPGEPRPEAPTLDRPPTQTEAAP